MQAIDRKVWLIHPAQFGALDAAILAANGGQAAMAEIKQLQSGQALEATAQSHPVRTRDTVTGQYDFFAFCPEKSTPPTTTAELKELTAVYAYAADRLNGYLDVIAMPQGYGAMFMERDVGTSVSRLTLVKFGECCASPVTATLGFKGAVSPTTVISQNTNTFHHAQHLFPVRDHSCGGV